MSRYGDTNPHFWSREEPDFPAPQHIQPEPRQPWDGHLHHPDHVVQQPDTIQVRPRQGRQRQSTPHQPPPIGSPPEVGRQQPPRPPQHYRPSGSPQRSLSPPPRSRPSRSPRLTLERRPPGPFVSQPELAHQKPSSPQQSYRPSGPSQHRSSPPPQNRPSRSPQHQHPVPLVGPPLGSTQVQPKPHPQHPRPHHVSFEQGAPPPRERENLVYPTPARTKPLTWFGAVFCVILWLVIILGGLLVLIIYLVYRPRTPHFEISSASLNAAYLDMGYLLNSDITVLANFTNPNKKVNVDFNYVVLQLYFDKHLIANQYIEPFSAFNTESKLANVEFVSSQVRLPLSVTQQLITQVQRNRISLEVDGIFHVRSNFGSLLRYSYWLYGHCQIELTGPPSGVMLSSHCRTKD